MRALAAIVFDFDGVVADCRRGALLPGAAEFLREAAATVPIGIASGAMTHEVEALLSGHRLLDLFAAVVGVDLARRSKPSPDPFVEVLHRMSAAGFTIDPSQAVGIDDSVSGLIAARAAGLRCVGVAAEERERQLKPHADLIVPGLHALTLDMLDTLVTGIDQSSKRHV